MPVLDWVDEGVLLCVRVAERVAVSVLDAVRVALCVEVAVGDAVRVLEPVAEEDTVCDVECVAVAVAVKV